MLLCFENQFDAQRAYFTVDSSLNMHLTCPCFCLILENMLILCWPLLDLNMVLSFAKYSQNVKIYKFYKCLSQYHSLYVCYKI